RSHIDRDGRLAAHGLFFRTILLTHTRYGRRERLPGIVGDVLVRDRPVARTVRGLVCPRRVPTVSHDEITTAGPRWRVLVTHQAHRMAADCRFAADSHGDASRAARFGGLIPAVVNRD